MNIHNVFENFYGSGLLWNEPMQKHLTFKAGGHAALLAVPQSAEELIDILKLCRQHNIPYFILGNGSNTLVADEGFDGVIIKTEKLCSVSVYENYTVAEAGVLLSELAYCLCEDEFSGFEFASGIPGSLGGAICMNAGAYGREMKDVLISVDCIMPDGTISTLQNDELELSYRSSRVKKEGLIVISAKMNFTKAAKQEIKNKMTELNRQRREKQPLEYPSAGSTFKRPEGYFAGKLIMDSGLAGFRIGGAEVSEKHCGFIINKDSATASDIIKVIERVQASVSEQYGVELEPEIVVIGNCLR